MRIRPEKQLENVKENFPRQKTSEFYELIPQVDTETDSDLMKPDAIKGARKLLSQFREAIRFQFPAGIPFSILPCILGLPEKCGDWPDPKQFQIALSILLSDCGFLFDEVRPAAEGRYAPQDFVAALDEKNHALDMCTAESVLISKTQQVFWEKYCPCEKSARRLSKQMVHQADPERSNWFRQCIMELSCLNQKAGYTRPLSLDFVSYCQEKWSLSKQQLEAIVLWENEGYRGSDFRAISLGEALHTLYAIWNELAERYRSELMQIQHYPSIGKEAYRRYQITYHTIRQIDQEMNSTPLQICNSSKLCDFLKKDLYELNRSHYLRPTPTPLVYTDTGPLAVMREKMEELYISYWKKRSNRDIKRSTKLQSSIDFILQVSLMEQFCIHDDDFGDSSAFPVTLAPVISFFIFCRYGSCADRVFVNANMKL